jgi:hypothetical protein
MEKASATMHAKLKKAQKDQAQVKHRQTLIQAQTVTFTLKQAFTLNI